MTRIHQSRDTTWHVYILECEDGTLYTGVTTDLARRLKEHQSGKGAKYTRSKGAVRMRYTESCTSRSEAFTREAEIKRLNRRQKLRLIKQHKRTV